MPGVVTPAAVADFLDSLRVERGLASATVDAYRRDLGQYLDFVDGREPAPDVVSGFVASLHRQGLATATIARKIAAVRGLHRHLLATGQTEVDPTLLLESPRRERPLPKALTVDQTFALLDAPDRSTPAGVRDATLLEFMYASAARVSETIGVDELDLDLHERTVLLTGKGDRQRVVPLGGAAVGAIETWLPYRAEVRTPAAQGAIFLNLRGRRISRQGVWSIVRAQARRAGISAAQVSPHVLRHSAATHMVEGGADLRTIQELLGHATIATTQIYTRVSPQHLLEVYATSHPRS